MERHAQRGRGQAPSQSSLLLADSAARCEDSLRTKRSARAEPADRPAVRFRGDEREKQRTSIPDPQRRDYIFFFSTSAKVSASVWDALESDSVAEYEEGNTDSSSIFLTSVAGNYINLYAKKKRIQTSTSPNNFKNMVSKSFLFLLKVVLRLLGLCLLTFYFYLFS